MWDLRFWRRPPAGFLWLPRCACSSSQQAKTKGESILELFWNIPVLEWSWVSSMLCKVLQSCRSMSLLRRCDLCHPCEQKWQWKSSSIPAEVHSPLWVSISNLFTSREPFHWVKPSWIGILGHVYSCGLCIHRSRDIWWVIWVFSPRGVCKGMGLSHCVDWECTPRTQIHL